MATVGIEGLKHHTYEVDEFACPSTTDYWTTATHIVKVSLGVYR